MILLVPLACAALLLASSPAPIQIVGNKVLPAEIYLTMIDSGGARPKGKITRRKAGRLARRVQDWLRQSGYEIAQVQGFAAKDRFVLHVDEGRVNRAVFRGLGEVATIQLRVKITLSMPHNIFNRPHLTRQLEALKEELGFINVAVELKDSPAIDHRGPQLESYPQVAGVEIVPLPAKYELIVTLDERDWQTGLGFILDLRPPDGVRQGLAYAGRHLLFDDDRYQVRASVALNQFGSFIPNDLNEWISFTRIWADGHWASPPLFGTGLRPSLSGYYDLKGRQRRDIALQKYYWMEHGAILNLGYDLDGWLRVTLGTGIFGRWLFDVEQRAEIFDPDTMPLLRPFDEAAGVVQLRSELRFNQDTIRLDHRHLLWAEGRAYFRPDKKPRWEVRAEYQRVFGFGWHELRLRAAAMGLWGPIRFVDEESLGFFLRGVFGNRHWVRRALGTSTGFRFSITRDLFQVGVFYEQALFENPARGNPPHRLMYANSMGPSIHVLLFHTMQADFYYSFGIDSDGFFEHGFSAGLVKAF